MKIEDVINSTFKNTTHKALVNIRYTSNFLTQRQNLFMKNYDLTMPQFNILRILRGAKKALAVNVVKDRMIEKSPNTTRLMDKLIEKGLINRMRCSDDRRIVFVEIAEKGLETLLHIDGQIVENDIFNVNLTEEESLLLSDLLDKLRG
ncbi:MAG: MarR family transcriptional regulator [Crocinitomicaceae bacterium]|nr:MarR family transcriptional regulator [Crocinitomicaceae bacterium]